VSKYEYKTKPYQHQIDVLRKCWNMEVYALFLEMGTGKTKIVLDNACALYLQGKIDSLMVMAPKGTYLNWRDEVAIHVPDYIDYCLAWWTPYPNSEELHRLQVQMNDSSHFHIMLVNIEAMQTKNKAKSKGQKYVWNWLHTHKPMVAVDESTTIKNPTASRTKAVLELAPLAKYRRIMSGNPLPNGLLDLWSQCAFLGTKYLGWDSFYAFKHHYAILKRRNTGATNGKGNPIFHDQVIGYCDELIEKELLPRLEIFSSKIRKEDCLDLPEKIYQKIEIKLSDEQEKLYKQMSKHAMAVYEDESGRLGHVSVTTVISLMLRLHQISCGFVTLHRETGEYLDPDEEVLRHEKIIQDLPNERMSTLLQQIEEIDGKVVIWAHYVHNIQTIIKELKKVYGDEAVCGYYGAIKSNDREIYRKRFQDPRDPLRFFVANKAGAYGINLTESSNVFYFANTFDLDVRMQSEDRNHRIGQRKAVSYIDIIAKKTIDEKIVEALKKKVKLVDLVMGSNGRRMFEY
jgi:SNF2 family DNA or RNA helicase